MLITSKTRLLLSFVALFSTSSFAQTAAGAAPAVSAAPSKIAFVNLQEAVVTCNDGKQEAATLQQRFAAKQNALKAQDDELKKLRDDYQARESKLNDTERNNRLRIIQDKQKAFDRNYADYQTENQEAQQEAISRITRKMLPVMEKFLVSHGYTALIDTSNPQAPVLWATKDSIITKQLVDAYNAQSTAAPAPATPAAPQPKKP